MIAPGGRGLAVAATLASVLVIALAGLGAVSTIGLGAAPCVTSAGAPTAEGERAIPAELMGLYQAAERRYHVPWSVLAAINQIETDFGRNLGPSSAGAIGWMQFMPATWRAYAADGDGRADPDNPADAIFTAAAYLRASGAPGDLSRAIFAYNHDDAYVERVLTTAKRYAQTAIACIAHSGAVRIAPGANRPGRPLAQKRSCSWSGWPPSTAVRSSSPAAPTTPPTPSTAASPTIPTATPPTSAWSPTAAATTPPSATAS